MLNKNVKDFIDSLPSDQRGGVRLHPLIGRASRGASLKELYAENRREHAVLAAAFKVAEMVANEIVACTHDWGHVIEGSSDFFIGTFSKYTRCCKCCPYKQEYVASRHPDTDELYQPVPEWVLESFKEKVPYWARPKENK